MTIKTELFVISIMVAVLIVADALMLFLLTH
jgi:hypothetical protein